MRTILWTGSRGWRDESIVRHAIEGFPRPFRSIVGDADGFDAIVWSLLSKFSLPRWRFNARWKLYRNGAGPKRNELMIAWLDHLDPFNFVVAGWDGKSPGTKNCIKQAEEAGIDVWRLGA